MADKERNVVLNFKMDGQVQYAKTIREINAVMNTAAKEYRNHVAAMGEDAKATDKLAAEKKKLEIQMEAARQRTQMLRSQYDAMSKDTKTTTGQLTQMYGKLLDAEKAEIALEKSMNRVNEGLSEQAIEARDAQQKMSELKNENKLLEAEQKSLNSSFKLQKAELGDNATETKKLELAQKQLTQQMELSERTVKNLESQLEQAKKIYGDNSIEVMQMESKLNEARTTIKKFSNSLDSIENSSNNASEGLDDLGKKMDLNNMIEAAELLQGVSDKLFEMGGNAFNSALSFKNSQTNIQANLDLTAKEAESLNDIVDQVFRNGIVGSVEEATEAVVLAKRTFEDLNDTDLENITNKITAMAQYTGTDVQENIRGAEQMMIAFGLTGEEALDLIAAGYQNGLNRSDDFMDTLVEYSPIFDQAGFSANEMLNILNNGLEDGAFNTDKAADAIKEFGVFLNDGTIADNIELYSDNTQKLFEQYEKGKATASEVFASISNDIVDTDKKQKQYEMGVSAFGTMYEDLGERAVESFSKTGGAIDEVNGKADEMAQKSPGQQWESSMRELQATLLPLGEKLIEIATEILPPLIEGIENASNWFRELSGPMQTFLIIFGGVATVGTILVPVIFGLAAAFTALQVPLLPIIGIIAALALAIAGIITAIENWGKITQWLGEKWEEFSAWIVAILEVIKSVFFKALDWLDEKTNGKFHGMIENIKKFMNLGLENIKVILDFWKDTFKNALDFLYALLTGDFEGMKNAVKNQLENMGTTVIELWNNVLEFFGDIDLWETGKKIIKGFIKGFTSLKIPKPHFSVSGKLDLNPKGGMSLPKVNIDWRAKGGIFTKPTIFGESNGRLQGAGEAGPEAVLPLNQSTLSAIGEGIAATLSRNKQPQIIQLVTPDSRVLAEMVVDDVTEIQEFNINRNKSFE